MNDFFTQVLWATWRLPYPVVVILVVFVAAWTALLLHELAHALVARVLGVRVWSITLGRGPLVWQDRVGGVRVRIGLLPLHGEVRLHDDDAHALGYHNVNTQQWGFYWREGSSWRAPLISAAGSLANLVGAAAVGIYWLLMPRLAPPSLALFVACFVVNLAMYLNLAPIRGLDGWRMAVQASAWRQQLVQR
jgi:membrane-associated protease RseP (regulator of RpoE activity)